jgi:hypothetical protein
MCEPEICNQLIVQIVILITQNSSMWETHVTDEFSVRTDVHVWTSKGRSTDFKNGILILRYTTYELKLYHSAEISAPPQNRTDSQFILSKKTDWQCNLISFIKYPDDWFRYWIEM